MQAENQRWYEGAWCDMGYALSRLEIDPDYSDNGSVGDDNDSHQSSSQNDVDPEVAQLTKLKSAPHDGLKRVLPRRGEFDVSPVKMLAGREGNYSGRGKFSLADRCHMLNKYLPVKGPSIVDQLTTRAYVSQFSKDGSLFVAAFQGSQIKIYNAEMGWKLHKKIVAESFNWTVTDTSISPDKRFLIYSTLSPIVNIVNIGSAGTESHANVTDIHEGLEFAADDEEGYAFGIFSVKFSSDGRELVAGSSDDSIYVYDIEAKRFSLRIQAHTSDVNSVCFADEASNLIYSGSDDNLCKVWDRRSIRSKGKPVGILTGHLEGITHLDSRNDGRYFISNGKDQTIKLWDIRKMSSNAARAPISRNYEWDYRWMDYLLRARDVKHPSDQSVATYKGHSVLRTLIRCYFSPEYSTGQRYIYTGSHDSCVYVYDLVTGARVARLVHHKSTVRDCSWHPYYPMLVSSSFDGDIAKWEFPGNGENPIPVNNSRPRRQYYD
ncbi:putative transcription factor WD40-like family [Helianthus annuus]|nr:putative transcription factor WD40-like family [Helianthus annuus]KAJ0471614.1 putative transcription factor WD40-like family [Helianthus annuus]KAJ0651130.1 putative transcription factor WD40-like family [Helianthus annuus]